MPQIELAARAIVAHWYSSAMVGPGGKDRLWELMRALRRAVKEADAGPTPEL